MGKDDSWIKECNDCVYDGGCKIQELKNVIDNHVLGGYLVTIWEDEGSDLIKAINDRCGEQF